MSLFSDDTEPEIVNIYDFYRSHGLSDHAAVQVVLHMLLTRTFAQESDARECARELGYNIPYVFPSSGTMH